jgi:NitT/TauT family transport system ATP-binding protein
MSTPLLTLDRVSKTYDHPVLQDISFTVNSGEFISIVGASGCGKSTLLKIIAGLVPPSIGQLQWKSAPRLSFVFQEPALLPWATVLENVCLPLKLVNMPRSKAHHLARSALAAVGLTSNVAAYPHQLSGGMKMRVSIARALVTAPETILLDEPFGALDDITRHKLNSELIALSVAQGWTTLLVTHNIYEAVYLADRVLVMSCTGSISDAINIDVPQPRAPEFRLSAIHHQYCQQVNSALAMAMTFDIVHKS